MRKAILNTICGVALGAGLAACSELPQVRVLHDPLTPEEHVTLGLTYEVQRHRDLAAREYRTALAQQAGYVPALIGLGNLAFAEGELEESEAFYRQALEASPEHPVANNNLAMLYLARGGDLREAERLALRALVHKGPLQPYVLDTLANVYARQGRFEEAVGALEEAEAVAPWHDKLLRDRLSRLRDQLVGTDAQEDRRTTEKPGNHPTPKRTHERSGEELMI